MFVCDKEMHCVDCPRNYPDESCEHWIEVAPVKRGKWIVYVISPFDGEDVKCSECGTSGCAPYWDYCPFCGAKNDEVVNEGDI